MNILLLFATNSGGTQTASEVVTKVIQEAGHTVTMKNVADASPDELSTSDVNIFATCTWDYEGNQGMPHEDFLKFIEKSKGKMFEGKKFAILGLGDRSYMVFAGSVDHLEKFVTESKGVLAVESLRVDGYYFDQAKNDGLITEWAKKVAAIQ